MYMGFRILKENAHLFLVDLRLGYCYPIELLKILELVSFKHNFLWEL